MKGRCCALNKHVVSPLGKTTKKMEYTFVWLIENYSYCWHKNGEALFSPIFIGLERRNLQLMLFPRGWSKKDEGYISLFVVKPGIDDGREVFSIKCELSLLTDNGLRFSTSVTAKKWKNAVAFGNYKFIQIDEILLGRNNNFLSQDILTVCCKMWKSEGKICDFIETTVRTCVQIEKISFFHVLKSFSTLQQNIEQPIEIISQSKMKLSISSNLYFTEGLCCEGRFMIEVVPSKQILLKISFFLLDVSGNLTKCGLIDNRYDTVIKSKYICPLSLTREEVLKRKNDYLPDDQLSLFCECTFSTGLCFKEIKETLQKKPCMVRNNINKSEKATSLHSSISEDLKDLYINQCLSDFKIKTKTKTFEAHKSVLCARSPVFKAMLTYDMKEKHDNCIHVDDLEDDIMEQMLLFLYSDTLGDLHWNTALQLYYAADKYQVDKLKKICSSFLTRNLIPNNAGELLIFADTHSDVDLKNLVEDFILEHEEQVFGSKEWEQMIETHPRLAIKTMHLKYKRKMN